MVTPKIYLEDVMGRELRKITKMNAESSRIPVLENRVSLGNTASEKRTGHRHTLTLDAEVHFSEHDIEGMFRCRTQNIGLNGAFIPSSAIPIETSMKVKVILYGKASASMNPGKYQVSAQVAHITDKGAGLIFSKLDNEQLQNFRRFLFKAKVAARQ